IRQIRNDVNKVLEEARIDKMIGSSLEAKVLLYIKDEELRNSVKSLNGNSKNGVDELRYFFLTSQAEMLDSPEMEEFQHKLQSDNWDIGVTKAEGKKCDRCWNYSTKVGESKEHPLLCERCVSALAGEF
ncbi:MAG: zinc finger domain-containing protein, partial [Cyanobacteria bacterium P01_D01_bin.50]